MPHLKNFNVAFVHVNGVSWTSMPLGLLLLCISALQSLSQWWTLQNTTGCILGWNKSGMRPVYWGRTNQVWGRHIGTRSFPSLKVYICYIDLDMSSPSIVMMVEFSLKLTTLHCWKVLGWTKGHQKHTYSAVLLVWDRTFDFIGLYKLQSRAVWGWSTAKG